MKGRIIKVLGGIYTVMDLETKAFYQASARGKLRMVTVNKNSSFNKQLTHKTKLETKAIKLSPKVGDYVDYVLEGDKYIINDVKERINDLERPLIANVDQVLLIFAAKEPEFQFNLLDQFLVLMEEAKVKAKIIMTKIDLLNEFELKELKKQLAYYESIGYPVYYVNSLTKDGFKEVEALFTDKISVLSGQTGAGKSTFINALIPGFNLETQEISQALGRGKHTTRCTELYQYNGGFIGDTPGFSKLDFSLILKEELKDYFSEFKNYSCKFRNCLHDKEGDCGVKKAVKNGEIIPSRYDNYLKFLTDIKQEIKKY